MTNALLEELNHATWCQLGEPAMRAALDAAVSALRAGFEACELTGYGATAIASVRHSASGTLFRFIPGGSTRIGMPPEERKHVLSLDEEDDELRGLLGHRSPIVKAMQPAHEVRVAPFLLAAEPLPSSQLEELLGTSDLQGERCFDPALIADVRRAIAAQGWRLPSEAEWEHACRAGTPQPFPSGVDALPAKPGFSANGFGLAMLGEYPEVCADGVHDNYKGAPCDGRPWTGEGNIVRGGAALFWPWQGPDWWRALCAARQPMDEEGGFAAVRPAVSLFPDEVAYGEESSRLWASALVRPAPLPPPPEPVAEKPKPAPRPDFEDSPTLILTNFDETLQLELMELTRPGTPERHVIQHIDRFVSRCMAGKPSFHITTMDSSPLIPPLMRLIAAPDTSGRSRLCLLAVDVLVQNHARFLPVLSQHRYTESLKLLAGSGAMLARLTTDGDARVRTVAPMLIALAGKVGRGLLLSRLRAETDETAAASLAIALGIVAHDAGSGDEEVRAVLEQKLEGAPFTRFGALLGLVTLGAEQTASAHLTALAAALDTVPPDGSGYGWHHGDCTSHAAAALRMAGERGEAAATESLRALLRASRDRRRRSHLVNELLAANFTMVGTERLDAATLTPKQRELLEELTPAEHAPVASFADFHIPADVVERRSWLDGKAVD